MRPLLSAVLASAALVLTPAVSARAEEPIGIEVSLETSPLHVRNMALERWARDLNDRSDGRLEVRIAHGASKYKDDNVPTVLASGELDMGAPGWWQTARFLPDHNLPSLPMFHGQPKEVLHAVFDGAVGEALNRQFEERFQVKVIGRWFDLGYAVFFFKDKQVRGPSEMGGLTIRYPGGPVFPLRLSAIGAEPERVAWPDVSLALLHGTIDGVITTNESVRSAKLWDAGITYAYADAAAFFQYIPAMSLVKWQALPDDMQEMILQSWEAMIPSVRALAAERQDEALSQNKAEGIKVFQPTAEQVAALQEMQMQVQAAIVEELAMDKALVAQAEAQLRLAE